MKPTTGTHAPAPRTAPKRPARPGATRRQSLVALAGGLAAAPLLSGCGSALSLFAGPAPRLYTLTPKNTFAPDLPRANWQLVVEDLTAANGLDSDRIALKLGQLEIKYYADVRWAQRAPEMLQTLLVESFENSQKIIAVGRRAIGLRADYSLKVDMREFQAEYPAPTEGDAAADSGGPPPTVRARLNAKLVRQRDGLIVASQSFEHISPTADDKIEIILVAFDEALGKVMRRVVEWSLREGVRDYQAQGEDLSFGAGLPS